MILDKLHESAYTVHIVYSSERRYNELLFH